MSLFARLARPTRGIWYLKRIWSELRGIRKALERQANALELQALPQHTPGAQTFRSMSSLKEDLSKRELHDATAVTYVNNATLALALEREDDLRAVLGRDPTDEELERAIEGIEV